MKLRVERSRLMNFKGGDARKQERGRARRGNILGIFSIQRPKLEPSLGRRSIVQRNYSCWGQVQALVF